MLKDARSVPGSTRGERSHGAPQSKGPRGGARFSPYNINRKSIPEATVTLQNSESESSVSSSLQSMPVLGNVKVKLEPTENHSDNVLNKDGLGVFEPDNQIGQDLNSNCEDSSSDTISVVKLEQDDLDSLEIPGLHLMESSSSDSLQNNLDTNQSVSDSNQSTPSLSWDSVTSGKMAIKDEVATEQAYSKLFCVLKFY